MYPSIALEILEKLSIPRDTIFASQWGFQDLKDHFADYLCKYVCILWVSNISVLFSDPKHPMLVTLQAHVFGLELVR